MEMSNGDKRSRPTKKEARIQRSMDECYSTQVIGTGSSLCAGLFCLLFRFHFSRFCYRCDHVAIDILNSELERSLPPADSLLFLRALLHF